MSGFRELKKPKKKKKKIDRRLSTETRQDKTRQDDLLNSFWSSEFFFLCSSLHTHIISLLFSFIYIKKKVKFT